MIAAKDKAFNEIFLSEISKFDSREYAYDTFFNCDSDRFSKIARQYGAQNGSGALNYMLKTFYSWKSNHVRPNSTSTYNIIASTAATFTIEEKFLEAYTQLAKHIKHTFPKRVHHKELNKTFEAIISSIRNFDLGKTTYYSQYIFKGEQIEQYQTYVQLIFEFYSKIIFESFNKDIVLFKKVYRDINTAFLETSFSTYLYDIEIDIRDTASNKFDVDKVFELDHPISYNDLLNDNLSDFSIDNVSSIIKAENKTKIDASLTEFEIEKLVDRKRQIESLKKGGRIEYVLKANSGILRVKLRILSPMEKVFIVVRTCAFILSLIGVVYYFLFLKKAYFMFFVGIFLSSFLVSPIYFDILNFFKDLFKPKPNGREKQVAEI
jgi:hypothetical protein